MIEIISPYKQASLPRRAAKPQAGNFGNGGSLRKKDVDPLTSPQTMEAQIAAIMEWSQVKDERFAELESIIQPTLVVNGSNDVMVPTVNSFTLSQHIPNAQLIVYPDSGHASLFQYPELFLSHALIFLN